MSLHAASLNSGARPLSRARERVVGGADRVRDFPAALIRPSATFSRKREKARVVDLEPTP